MDIDRQPWFRAFPGFCARLTLVHFFTYVLVGGTSYMLIMRHVWSAIPADVGLREITSPWVQTWLWPAQLFRGIVLAAVFLPIRDRLLSMGRWGGLYVAGVMIGIGWLAGFTGLSENLIFYHNASLYLHYIHIPEVTCQTLAFGYLLMWWEKAAARPRFVSLGAGLGKNAAGLG